MVAVLGVPTVGSRRRPCLNLGLCGSVDVLFEEPAFLGAEVFAETKALSGRRFAKAVNDLAKHDFVNADLASQMILAQATFEDCEFEIRIHALQPFARARGLALVCIRIGITSFRISFGA